MWSRPTSGCAPTISRWYSTRFPSPPRTSAITRPWRSARRTARSSSWWRRRRSSGACLRSRAQDLSRVHDVVRVKRSLDALHEIELHRIGITLELEHFQLADAVLGGKAAAELLHEVVDSALHFLLHRLQLRGLGARTLVDVEVQIAVAEMAIGDQHALRNVLSHPAAGDFDEARHLRHGHRDVVLDAVAILALRFGYGFAQPPEGIALPVGLG